MSSTSKDTKKPRKPLSYSELHLFLHDRDNWELRYLQGIKPEPTFKMKRGSDLHAFCLQDKQEVLERYMPFERRAFEAMAQALKKQIPKVSAEKKVHSKIGEADTLGFWDGYAEGLIVELKTSTSLWDEAYANEHRQLDFYATQHYFLYGSIPKLLLATGNATNGKLKVFEVEKTENHIKETTDLINQVWEELKQYEPLRTRTSL